MRREPRQRTRLTRGRSSYDEASRSRALNPDQRGAQPNSAGFKVTRSSFFKLLAGLGSAVGLKLLYLDFIKGPEYRKISKQNRTNVIPLYAKRGTIFDRKGNVLAMSQDCETIYANPQEVNDPSGAAEILADELSLETSDFLPNLTLDGTFVYLKRKVDSQISDSIKKRLQDKEIAGIYFLPDSKRVYPYGKTASQILGIVGTDGDGLTGLELYYNDILKGTDGQMILETGRGGMPIAGSFAQIDEAKNGTDLTLAIDIGVQEVAEREIVVAVEDYKADSGSVVVTDPKSGEILACCSTPLYDVTNTKEIEEGATSLKPISASYEPGSIFKLITISAGIENGLIDPDSTFSVPSSIIVGSDTVKDDDNRDYQMNMTVREILRRSSNVGTALVAQEVIGKDRFAEQVSKFHIGQKTSIDYPGEVEGIVKTRQQYDPASLGAMSFGQSLAVPLIQMVKAIGAIANKGTLCTPHFVKAKAGKEQTWPTVGQAVSENTCNQMIDMMRTVVKEGTAKGAQVPGYDIAGKTGTGEQYDEKGGYRANYYVSSLIGIAPASDPEVLVYVGLNGTPYLASGSAAPTFAKVMTGALSELGIQPTN